MQYSETINRINAALEDSSLSEEVRNALVEARQQLTGKMSTDQLMMVLKMLMMLLGASN